MNNITPSSRAQFPERSPPFKKPNPKGKIYSLSSSVGNNYKQETRTPLRGRGKKLTTPKMSIRQVNSGDLKEAEVEAQQSRIQRFAGRDFFETQQELKRLLDKKEELNESEIHFILTIAAELQNLKPEEKEMLDVSFKNQVTLLLNTTKVSRYLATIQAAAAKGKAATAGIAAAFNLQDTPTIHPKGDTRHKVFLKNPAALKQGSEKAKEEEYLASELLYLYGVGKESVGIFSMKNIAAERFGAEQINQRYLADSFLAVILNQELEDKLVSHLTSEAEKELYEKIRKEKFYFHKLVDTQWEIEEKGEWKPVLFQDLKRWFDDNFPSSKASSLILRQVGESNSRAVFDHFDKNSALAQALSYRPSESVGNFVFIPDFKSEEQEEAYIKCSKITWEWIDQEEKSHFMSFKTLRELIVSGKANNGRISTPHELSKEFDSASRVSYRLAKIEPKVNREIEIQRIYDKCNKFQWSYKGFDGNIQIIDFTTLRVIIQDYLAHTRNDQSGDSHSQIVVHLKNVFQRIKALDQNYKSQYVSLENELFQALLKDNLGVQFQPEKWKLSHLEVYQDHAIQNIQAKPFLSEMVLLYHLQQSDDLLKAMGNKIDQDSWVLLARSLEVQFLDLHDRNVGMSPKINEDYEKLKNVTFLYSFEDVQLDDLDKCYAKKSINNDTVITRTKEGPPGLKRATPLLKVSKPLKDFPELLKFVQEREARSKENLMEKFGFGEENFSYEAQLNLQDLHLLYLDGLLSLDTPIKYKEKGSTIEHSTTLRNFPELKRALDVQWKVELFDLDLNLAEDNAMHLVTNVNPRTKKSETGFLIPLRSAILELKWKDIPFSPSVISQLENSQAIDQRVRDWIRYADARIRKSLSQADQMYIDNLLYQQILPRYVLTKRRQTPEITIQELRKSFIKEVVNGAPELWSFLEEKLKYDLTSSPTNPDIRKKRKAIAAQLFPRLTVRQQNALIERQERRARYLANYRHLKTLHGTLSEILNGLAKIVQDDVTPLSILDKKNYVRAIQELSETVKEDEGLEEVLQEQSRELAISLKAASDQGEQKKIKKEIKEIENQRLDLLEMTQKKTKLVAELYDEIKKSYTPTYFNLAKAMYPLLADVHKLITALVYGEHRAGMRIGDYRYLIESFLQEIEEMKAEADMGRNRKWDENWEQLYELSQQIRARIQSEKDPAVFQVNIK